jgi:hypothetical protein
MNEDQGDTAKFKITPSPLSRLPMAIGTSILGSDLELSSPVSNLNDYFRLELEGRLDKLNTLEPLKENRHLVTDVRKKFFSHTAIYHLVMCWWLVTLC